jgi:hypothetical protein
LGLVGAGGIGLRLSERIQINAWDQVAYIIVLILITVSAIDYVSKRIRTRLIPGIGLADSQGEDSRIGVSTIRSARRGARRRDTENGQAD